MGGRAVDGRHRRTTLSVVGQRCGNVVTPSSPRWQRGGVRVVRRVQRRDAYVERTARRAQRPSLLRRRRQLPNLESTLWGYIK